MKLLLRKLIKVGNSQLISIPEHMRRLQPASENGKEYFYVFVLEQKEIDRLN
jgi:hypothetical protein